MAYSDGLKADLKTLIGARRFTIFSGPNGGTDYLRGISKQAYDIGCDYLTCLDEEGSVCCECGKPGHVCYECKTFK